MFLQVRAVVTLAVLSCSTVSAVILTATALALLSGIWLHSVCTGVNFS